MGSLLVGVVTQGRRNALAFTDSDDAVVSGRGQVMGMWPYVAWYCRIAAGQAEAVLPAADDVPQG
ncbi:hypothetical protein AMK29_19345 [Streptomyces sp. CB02261]|nr:hypothetical protein AMK29_19345 [Streptomyces sp. CB02261]